MGKLLGLHKQNAYLREKYHWRGRIRVNLLLDTKNRLAVLLAVVLLRPIGAVSGEMLRRQLLFFACVHEKAEAAAVNYKKLLLRVKLDA